MAVGSPFGFSQSVTTGIISALERNAVGINEYESFIQTDAPINRGNSGGPLVNMDGEVIGINSAIVSGSSGNDGIGFTIPINMAASVADMLIKDGKVHYARIGIAARPLTPALARQLGLDEGDQGRGGRQRRSGQSGREGRAQGRATSSSASPARRLSNRSSFRLKVATSEVSKPYELVFLRDGKERTTSIVPAPSEKVVFDSEREATEADRKPANPRRRRSATSASRSSR